MQSVVSLASPPNLPPSYSTINKKVVATVRTLLNSKHTGRIRGNCWHADHTNDKINRMMVSRENYGSIVHTDNHTSLLSILSYTWPACQQSPLLESNPHEGPVLWECVSSRIRGQHFISHHPSSEPSLRPSLHPPRTLHRQLLLFTLLYSNLLYLHYSVYSRGRCQWRLPLPQTEPRCPLVHPPNHLLVPPFEKPYIWHRRSLFPDRIL